ncbi:hypothetical protein BZA77DRAFT_384858 [Pyronema omphalodes]|nr:hypothetical protein BZA77DRAFT_384858 [Pyronema omphalodes]
MFSTLFSLFVLASGFANALPQFEQSSTLSSTFDPDAFTPGINIDPRCFANPSINVCPAKLESGNALVTATHVNINENTNAPKPSKNIIRAGWSWSPNLGTLTEESTIALFDFPSGMEGKQCRFQFVSDDGDRLDDVSNVYNIWTFKKWEPMPTTMTTYWNKPQRDQVVATFTTTLKENAAKRTTNAKYVHKFLFGPGGDSGSFPCPMGGKVAWEVASAVKTDASGRIMNIGGASGLGIEIIGVPAGWHMQQ